MKLNATDSEIVIVVIADLTEAKKKTVQGHLEQALEILLTCWGKTPVAALATSICMLGQLIRERQLPLSQMPMDEYIRSTEHFGAEDINRICEDCTDRSSGVASERVTRLEEWPADPRVDWWLLQQLMIPPYHASQSKPFFRKVVEVLRSRIEQHDLRWLAVRIELRPQSHQRVHRSLSDWLEAELDDLAALIGSAPDESTLPKNTMDAIEELRIALDAAPKKGMGERLLEQVFAEPSSDDTRLVYSDYLCEQSDPHGEFIALQMERARTGESAPSKKERSLERSHWRSFAKSIASAVEKSTLVFRRGFAYDATVKGTGPKIAAAVGAPHWATVRHLTIESNPKAAMELLAHPVMSNLESLRLIYFGEREAKILASLENELSIRRLVAGSANRWLALVLNCQALPKIESLWVHSLIGLDEYIDLCMGDLGARLIEVGVLNPGESWMSAAQERFPLHARMERIVAGDPSEPLVVLRRGKDRAFSHLWFRLSYEVGNANETALNILEQLAPASLHQIEYQVEGQPQTQDRPFEDRLRTVLDAFSDADIRKAYRIAGE